jgi:D-alanyl-lipoteichoic acid acyltransferase DltB (MBOAT superfamily)|tara:strand:- start:1337 stop:2851 length:1515 start_codon:yes stop_codon:yes gene_type:complete
MLFNSYEFIFYFLPSVLVLYYGSLYISYNILAVIILIIASLFFYAWWNPIYLILIIFSILVNYTIGNLLKSSDINQLFSLSIKKKLILIVGISINLFLLGYFKYANFFIENINHILNTNIFLEKIVLPLAISFFTFQQIMFLVDSYSGRAKEYNFLKYCLFVTFFPQLIAGPVVHHSEMMPQFENQNTYRFNYKNLLLGLVIFFIGLFKKIILADNIAVYATPLFDAAEHNITLTFFEAWGGVLAFTFQIYFDFSGYSDMAIGLARMFGILLPLNFNSPYKAYNIQEFWKRWHMTLSRFLKNYLYIPLGGNRKGKNHQYINLMITMFLGGLWHGANWTFVIWGILHGIYLVIHKYFYVMKTSIKFNLNISTKITRGLSRLTTFVAVAIGWTFFRSETLNGAMNMMQGMFGFNGIFFTTNIDYKLLSLLTLLLIISWFIPNTQEFFQKYRSALEIYKGQIKIPRLKFFRFNLNNYVHIIFIVLIILLSIFSLMQDYRSEFLYFNF